MLPSTNRSTFDPFELPSRLFGSMNDRSVEMYEQDDEFVLGIELPGFDREEISLSWDEGRLYVTAEHTDDELGREKTYHRTFRFPREVVTGDISAKYENGVLKVHLPIVRDATAKGEPIPIEG